MENADRALFARAKLKDISAFEELILPLERLVYSIAYRMLGNTQDAKDASQEVWFKVYKNLSKCKSDRAFKAWVCAIVNNTCLDFLRKRKSRIQTVSTDEFFRGEDEDFENTVADKDSPAPDEILISKERSKAIKAAIGVLNPIHRTMIVYRDIEGFSYEEIASVTGTNIGTVKSQISRARGALRKILSEMREQDKF